MQPGALKSEQKKIFNKLKHFPRFYLGGGTALALQMGHRISVDFDLFSPDEIPKGLLSKIRRVFKDFKIGIILNHPEQLTVKAGQTRMDFVKYNFPLILKTIELNGVRLVSIPEIAAMKAFAINQRGTLKDYVDLYFVLKEGHTDLKEIKKIAEEKYKNDFNFRLFLEQLVYFGDIKSEKIVFLKRKTDRSQIQAFFQKEIKKLKI